MNMNVCETREDEFAGDVDESITRTKGKMIPYLDHTLVIDSKIGRAAGGIKKYLSPA